MHVPLQDFRKRPATHIVSLGRECAATYNLRRYYNFGDAFPFDWWRVEAPGLIRFLAAPDIDVLYDPERLELTPDSSSVAHRDFGFLLHHEFPRYWKLADQPVRKDWPQYLSRPKERTNALLTKLLRLNAVGNRIAFIREESLSTAVIEPLESLFSRTMFTLVVLDRVSNTSDPAIGWKGDRAAWDRALGALGLQLDRTGHRPFTEPQADPTLDSNSVSMGSRVGHRSRFARPRALAQAH